MSEISKSLITFLAVAGCAFLTSPGVVAREQRLELNPKLAEYVADRVVEFDDISSERKSKLRELARYITNRNSAGQTAKLAFICTHNSRRSHISRLWAAAAAAHYGVDAVETYSGGTERTAFNPRAVAALERAGFELVMAEETTSPADTA